MQEKKIHWNASNEPAPDFRLSVKSETDINGLASLMDLNI
jgi:hypothetical protein